MPTVLRGKEGDMSKEEFSIYKQGNKWIVEPKNGSNPERSEHNSRIKALVAFFVRHPGLKSFYIVITKGVSDGDKDQG